jgi:hypothetical protein
LKPKNTHNKPCFGENVKKLLYFKVAQNITIFGRKTAAKPEKAKINAPKLNLKFQNIYTKPLLKPKNTHKKP